MLAPGFVGVPGDGVDDDVSDEALVAGLSSRTMTALRWTPGCGVRARFDFAEFDAVAAEFDLVVGAADVFELAVRFQRARSPVRYMRVPGWAVGVGGEAFGGEGGAVVVAAGELVAGEVELSGDAGGGGSQARVEDVGGGVVEGRPMGMGPSVSGVVEGGGVRWC